MNLPTDDELNQMAVKIHGLHINRWRHRHGSKTVTKHIPTSFEALTPAERRGVMTLCIAARQADSTWMLADDSAMNRARSS
jgi:hypothetical protein